MRGIGHAIDVELFSPAARTPSGGPLRLLALGRIARWKGYDTLLEGFRLAVERGLEATLELRGPAADRGRAAHRAELERT